MQEPMPDGRTNACRLRPFLSRALLNRGNTGIGSARKMNIAHLNTASHLNFLTSAAAARKLKRGLFITRNSLKSHGEGNLFSPVSNTCAITPKLCELRLVDQQAEQSAGTWAISASGVVSSRAPADSCSDRRRGTRPLPPARNRCLVNTRLMDRYKFAVSMNLALLMSDAERFRQRRT
jgi:hypothetical protein